MLTVVELLGFVHFDDVLAQLFDHRLELVLLVLVLLLKILILSFQLSVRSLQHVDLDIQTAHFLRVRTGADHRIRRATAAAATAIASFRALLVAAKLPLQFFIELEQVSFVQGELVDSFLQIDVLVDDQFFHSLLFVVVHMFHRARSEGEDRVVDVELVPVEPFAQRPNFRLNDSSVADKLVPVHRSRSRRYPPMW